MDPISALILTALVVGGYVATSPDRFAAPVRTGVRAGVRSGAGRGVRSAADRWRAGQPRRADRRQRGRERLDRFSIPLPQFGRRPRVSSGQVSAPISGAPGGGQVKGGRKAAAPPTSITAPPPRPPRKRIPVGRGLNRFADGVQAAVGGTARTALGAGAIGWEAGRTATRTGREEWATARREHEERRARGERTRAGRAVRLVGHKIRGTVDEEAVERRNQAIRETPQFQQWADHQGAVPQGSDFPGPDRSEFHDALDTWGEREDQLQRDLDPVLAAGSAGQVAHAAEQRVEPKHSRRVDGQPETEDDSRFFDLRSAGYKGWINQAGMPVDGHGQLNLGDEVAARVLRRRAAYGDRAAQKALMLSATAAAGMGAPSAQGADRDRSEQVPNEDEDPEAHANGWTRSEAVAARRARDWIPELQEQLATRSESPNNRETRERLLAEQRRLLAGLEARAAARRAQTTPPTGGGSTTRTEAPVSVDIETYEDLETELGQVENGWDEHAAPLLAQFAALARAWDEHGEQAKAAVQRAKDINEDVTDQNGFVPGQAVLAAIEAMVEQLGAIQTTFFEAATEDLETVSKADQAAKDADETIATAIQETKREHELVGDVAAETGADVRTTAAV